MKKKIFLPALALCLMATTLIAQRQVNGAQRAIRLNVPVTTERFSPLVENDTIFGPAFSEACGANITTYLSDNWGFIAGTNGYFDLEKAQRISLGDGDNFTIQEIWGFFAAVTQAGNGPLRAKVYAVDATGAPGDLLGTSATINVDDIDTSSTALVPTVFNFPTPVAVTGDEVFISLDFSDLYTEGAEDIVGLWMTEDGCGDGSDAYELFSDGVWHQLDMAPSWGLEVNFLIGAVVEFDPISSLEPDPVASADGIRLFAASPNPGSNEIIIGYALDESSKVQIQLYTTDGKLIQTIDKGLLTPGEFKETLYTNQLPAGTYVYGLITEKGRLMNKLIIER